MFAKTSRIVFGGFFALFGILGILVGIIAIIDPVGSKMADDNDPFGVPPTLAESLSLIAFYILIFAFGLGLITGFKQLARKFSRNNLK